MCICQNGSSTPLYHVLLDQQDLQSRQGLQMMIFSRKINVKIDECHGMPLGVVGLAIYCYIRV